MSNTIKTNNNNTIFHKCLAGGIGCGVSGFVTNPIDVIKIKNQQYRSAQFRTFTGTAQLIWQEQGVRGFLKGASASLMREVTYSSLRMGLYEPIKDVFIMGTNSEPDSPLVKWASAFLSGAIGAAIFNPFDLIKVRFQAQLPGQPQPYTSVLHAAQTIYATEGGLIKGLYNGTTPTVVRAAFLTSAQLGSYDIIKNNFLVQQCCLPQEGYQTHFSAALVASLVTTTAANPADVVKTRVMNDREMRSTKALHHFKEVYRKDGLRGYMKGWTASYLRIGPHTIISFLVIERVRQMMGMTTY